MEEKKSRKTENWAIRRCIDGAVTTTEGERINAAFSTKDAKKVTSEERSFQRRIKDPTEDTRSVRVTVWFISRYERGEDRLAELFKSRPKGFQLRWSRKNRIAEEVNDHNTWKCAPTPGAS